MRLVIRTMHRFLQRLLMPIQRLLTPATLWRSPFLLLALLWTVPALTNQPPALLQLPAATLDVLQEGDVLRFQLPGDGAVPLSVAAEITRDHHYPNGDRVLRGVDPARNVMMVLTLNDQAAFADVMVNDTRWVFSGERQGDVIAGRFDQPTRVALDPALNDFVIPDRLSSLVLQRPQPDLQTHAMTYSATGSAAAGSDAVSAPGQAQNGLRVEQYFSEPVLHVGEARQLDVTLVLHNDTPRSLSGLPLDVYFILEDARLVHAPGCRQVLSPSRQPVLSCGIGEVAPGATRHIQYTVLVDAKPDPMRLWSTALVGTYRHDAHLNIVYDVLAGADTEAGVEAGLEAGLEVGLEAGGLSDFNRALLNEVPVDELGNVVIDILALYTPDAAALYGHQTPTRINQMVSVSNQIYQDSGIGITLRPVFHAPVDYPAGTQVDMYRQLEQLTYGTHPAFSEVSQLRDHFGADLVVLFRALGPNAKLCGVANLGGHDTRGDMLAFEGHEYGFSVVALDCPLGSALAHELGHNMGLTHSRREDGVGGTLPYATGHGIDHGFATVMANPARFGTATKIPLFSSPQLDCGGLPCGVDYTDPERGADAVRTLNLTRFQVAAYRPTRVPHLPWREVGHADGRSTDARIALTARVNRGSAHTQHIGHQDVLDVAASFYVDPAHVGRLGQFHIVADLQQAGLGYAQLDQYGGLHEWDEEVSGLVPFNSPRPLAAVEYLQVLSEFVPLPEMAGYPLVLFVAYQLPDTGEVIFTTDPLVIDIQAAP